MDCVPVLSQVKSAALFIKGNKQRASETQKRFIGTCYSVLDHIPLVSQAKSIAQLMHGDKRAAVKTQENFIKTPLVAHLGPVVANIVRSQRTSSLEDLKFEPGDVIFCRFRGAKGIFCYHVMLATSSETVAHCVQVDSSLAELREEPWIKVISDLSFRKGFVNRKFCDFSFLNRVSRPLRYPGMTSVKRALFDIERFKGHRVYYNLFQCNCEHWVSFWVSGEALSDQAYLLGKSGKVASKSPINKYNFNETNVI